MKQTHFQLLALTIGSLAGITLSTPNVEAAILWDYSPETTLSSSGISNFVSESNSSNFAELVFFPNAVQLTGMDIYSINNIVTSVGDSVTIRIWTDNAGTPGTLIHDFTDTISVIDNEGIGLWSDVNRKFADFSASPINLEANTPYWIGMSGTNTNISQATLINTNPGDGQIAQFNGTSFNNISPFGDMAFRLQGEVENIQTTPEPNSGISFLALGILGGVSLIKTKKPQ